MIKSQVDVHFTAYVTGRHVLFELCLKWRVPTGSPSRGGDVTVYVFDINQPSLPTHFYSVLVFVSVFVALSTVFHSIKSPDNSLLSHSEHSVLFLPYWSFQLHLFMKASPIPATIFCG